MNWVITGLGNPDASYKGTRHNTGRDFLEAVVHTEGGKNTLFGKKVKILVPATFMNDSGKAIKPLIKSIKAAEGLIVLHDDLDLPLGKVKISFGSSSGGHKGVESIHKALKTKNFTRIRIGISPTTPGGKLKKPDSADVINFVLATFKPAEQETLKKVRKTVAEALELLLKEGREHAMTEINSR